jgi:hypothetical protein
VIDRQATVGSGAELKQLRAQLGNELAKAFRDGVISSETHKDMIDRHLRPLMGAAVDTLGACVRFLLTRALNGDI